MSVRRIAANAAWLSVIQFLNYAVPLLTVPVVARAFGPTTYGFIATAIAYMTYAGLFVTFGFDLSGSKRVAQAADDRQVLSYQLSTILFGQLSLAAIACLIFAGIMSFLPMPGHDVAILTLLFSSAVIGALNPVWLFVGRQAMRSVVIPQFVVRVTGAFLIILLIRSEKDVLAYALIGLGTAAFGLMISLWLLWRDGIGLVRASLRDVIAAVRSSASLFMSSASVSLYTTTNLVVVQLLLGSTQAGYFALAERIRGAVSGLLDPISRALYPFLCGGAEDTSEQVGATRRFFFRSLVLISLALSAGLFVAAPLLVDVLGGSKFAEAAPLLRIFALAPVLLALSNILGIQTMLPANMERQLSIIFVCAGVGGVSLLVAMTTMFGLRGAATSYILVEAFVTVTMAIVVGHRQSLAQLFVKQWQGWTTPKLFRQPRP